ncbi:MAG: hypothetical protein AAGA30_04885 [Planctomycetota bacterium]
MTFDQLKQELDHSIDNQKIPTIDFSRSGKDPLSRLCGMMLFEIWIQWLALLVFLVAPFAFPMTPLPRAVYYFAMFVTGMLTLSYLVKLKEFRSESSTISLNTRDTLHEIIGKAKRVVECMECYAIAGCALLPASMSALLVGNAYFDFLIPKMFDMIFLLEISWWKIALILLLYFASFLGSIWVVKLGTRWFYWKHIGNLEAILNELVKGNHDSSETNLSCGESNERKPQGLEKVEIMRFFGWSELAMYGLFFVIIAGSASLSPVVNSSVMVQVERTERPTNMSFEYGILGEIPNNWSTSSRRPQSKLSDKNPLAGEHCLEINGDYVFQETNAAQYRGKKIRFRCAVKIQADTQCHAQLLMDIGLEENINGQKKTRSLNFYNMHDRPITNTNWQYHEIILEVPEEATYLTFGSFTVGRGIAWLDDASIEIVDSSAELSGYQELSPRTRSKI